MTRPETSYNMTFCRHQALPLLVVFQQAGLLDSLVQMGNLRLLRKLGITQGHIINDLQSQSVLLGLRSCLVCYFMTSFQRTMDAQ
jgi:hypothetical protein